MTITEDLQAQTASLSKLYTLLRPDEVIAYLQQYPFLMPILQEAPTKIHQFFPDSPLRLEVITFQDSNEGERLLVIGVVPAPTHEPEVAIEIMNRLGEEWWLDVDEFIQRKLEIFLKWQ